jgi:probable rRNA maturation factor
MGNEPRSHEVANRQRRARLRKGDICQLIDHLLDSEKQVRPVSIVFVGRKTIRDLNREWMGEDRVTDVLSFPSGPPVPGVMLAEAPVGEVIVCVPVCEDSAQERGVSLNDEVARMLIHGVLHLLGYDHGSKLERQQMGRRERRYLAFFRRRGLEMVERG